MRPIAIVPLVLLLLPVASQAQSLSRLAGAEGRPVFVIDADSREWQGKLLKASKDTLTIESEAGIREFPLVKVKRVDADGDRIRDGAIKGAVCGLILGALASGNGTGAGRIVLGSAMIYGLIGAGVDAINQSKHTVYRAPAPQAQLTVRW
jgi:uncharacterized protein YcfJ